MCYEVNVYFTLCRHRRYFVIPAGTTAESPSCYTAPNDPASHLATREFTARIRIVDMVHECAAQGCGILGNPIDYRTMLIAALTRRERAEPGAVDPAPGFPWGVDHNVAEVEWTTVE